MDVDGLLALDDLWALYDIDGHRELRYEPWTPVVAAAVRRHGGGHRGRVRRDARGRPARPPPVPLVRRNGGALRAAGREGPRRARDQDDGVPHLGRLRPRAGPDRGGRARQAGGLPGGAEGALRRAPQHRLGARAGGGGRARGARAARPEDAREGAAGGAPRGLASAPLRAHRDRQLPREDRAPVRGLRAVHVRPRDRRRRGGAVQLAHRRGALARVPQGGRGAGPHARLVPRRGRADDRGQAAAARTRASC